MARIAAVCSDNPRTWDLRDMSYIRWQKICEALARVGHDVDILTNEPEWKEGAREFIMQDRLRRIPLRDADWSRYDVVKTLFHKGFEVLERYGGARHPFIISKLGSVVGDQDLPGVYFYGEVRRRLLETQARIHARARYITVLNRQAGELLTSVHGKRNGLLIVPGGVDAELPPPGPNPYEGFAEKICLFSGHIYFPDSQPEANRVLVDKLNRLGRCLEGSGLRVCFQGTGDLSRLDARYVTNLGSAPYHQTWDYFRHASVGIVVCAGEFMHNNESSKIYHYLRSGLPVVSESGFPNDNVVRESGLGFVCPSGDMEQMAAKVRAAAVASWDRERAIAYIRANHTWDCRARVYQPLLPAESAGPAASAVRKFRMRVSLESRPPLVKERLKRERIPTNEKRSPERLQAHYAVETELAARLRSAPRGDRGPLYAAVYDELFRRVPDHPQLTRKRDRDSGDRHRSVLNLIAPLLRPDAVFLEIGSGDGALAQRVAAYAKTVYALEVSRTIAEQPEDQARETGITLLIANGCGIPLETASVDFVYSNQVIEHLHPGDAQDQLREIARVLKTGGTFLCITPNRLSGPHDISRYFDDVATGFHLKEYTASELVSLLRSSGFRKIEVFGAGDGRPAPSFLPMRLIENALAMLPISLRRAAAARSRFSFAADIRIVGTR